MFTNCGEDSEDPVADTPTNNTDDDNTDDDSTDDGNIDDSSTDTVTYTLTLTASEGGTFTPESGSYNENEYVELLATPDSTYVFVNWTGSSTSSDNPLSVTMDADKNYTVTFERKQYPLSIIVEGEGAVSEEIITNGRVEDYDVGTLVQLTANPSEGWKFDKWVELDVYTNPLEVSITDSVTLTAKFHIPIDSVSITPSSLQMVVGYRDTLKADLYPSIVSDTINWKSSDESIATVNQEGVVTAVNKGEALITVITAKDSITNTAKVVVSIDGDKDGIIDEDDTCADTPEGAAVDTNGCAGSQKDTDEDGVTDDLDTCPDTLYDSEVDANGCADSQKDTDGDGVKDDKDTCVDTPEGATVDANGCADSQKDTDEDGVTDDLDTCADTSSGETADSSGCSDSQKDADGDGVTDDKDTCADTAEGAEVDENGCVITIDDSSSSTFNINVTANSSSNYSLAGTDRNGDVSGNDPELTFKVGDVINFSVNASGHPFYLKTTAGTGVDNGISGVTNNGTTDDTASWTPTTAGTYYYQCSLHGGMVGTIIIE